MFSIKSIIVVVIANHNKSYNTFRFVGREKTIKKQVTIEW